MRIAQQIVVQFSGAEVFRAAAGRNGVIDSANRDFIGFASPIVGAAGHYLACDEWAERLALHGFETVIIADSSERRIAADNNSPASRYCRDKGGTRVAFDAG